MELQLLVVSESARCLPKWRKGSGAVQGEMRNQDLCAVFLRALDGGYHLGQQQQLTVWVTSRVLSKMRKQKWRLASQLPTPAAEAGQWLNQAGPGREKYPDCESISQGRGKIKGAIQSSQD